jgi:hypothetical protein
MGCASSSSWRADARKRLIRSAVGDFEALFVCLMGLRSLSFEFMLKFFFFLFIDDLADIPSNFSALVLVVESHQQIRYCIQEAFSFACVHTSFRVVGSFFAFLQMRQSQVEEDLHPRENPLTRPVIFEHFQANCCTASPMLKRPISQREPYQRAITPQVELEHQAREDHILLSLVNRAAC